MIIKVDNSNAKHYEKLFTDAYEVLREAGYMTMISKVIAVAIEDKPGTMAEILGVLAAAEISVEYTYAFLSAKAGAYMIFRVDDNQKAA